MEKARTSNPDNEPEPDRLPDTRLWPTVAAVTDDIIRFLGLPYDPSTSSPWNWQQALDRQQSVLQESISDASVLNWLHLAEDDARTRLGFKLTAENKLEGTSDPNRCFLNGLQFVVLALHPGSQEFFGACVRSPAGIVTDRTARRIRHALHVPPRRGAVNWMTALSEERTSSHSEIPPEWRDLPQQLLLNDWKGNRRPRSPVVTIFDAWRDLRGRAASEDLILGNRSVSGFPLKLSSEAVVGFFFISHPLPGLFLQQDGQPEEGKRSERSNFELLVDQIRRRFGSDLSNAIEMDMLAWFAHRNAPGQAWRKLATLGGRFERFPLIDLGDDDPAGFMASMLFEPGQHSRFRPHCNVNEGSFIRQIWTHFSLASFFLTDWQPAVARAMETFSAKIEKAGIEKKELVDSIDWEAQGPRPHDPQKGSILQEHIAACLELYSGYSTSRIPPADLRVAIVDRQSGPRPQVVAILRFNCDSPPEDHPEERDNLESVLRKHKDPLDDSLGYLLGLADGHVCDLVRTRSVKEIADLYKQLADAVRLLSDWCANRLIADLLQYSDIPALQIRPSDAGLASEWDIVCHAFNFIRQRLAELAGNRKTPFTDNAGDSLKALLEQVHNAVQKVAGELVICSPTHLTLVTIWLRVWNPVIDDISLTNRNNLPEDRKQFGELVDRDPGLLDVLRHLVCTSTWANFKRPFPTFDLCQRARQHKPKTLPLEVGFPAREAHLESLMITPKDCDTMEITWRYRGETEGNVQLHWTVEPDEKLRSLLPAALAFVPGRVSKRVGSVIAGNVEVSLAPFSAIGISEHRHINDLVLNENTAILRRLKLLEMALSEVAGGDPCKCWTILPLTRSEQDSPAPAYLCVLAPHDRKRNLVPVSRRLVLSNASARFRTRWLEKEREKFRATRTSHGFYGPAEQLRSGLNMVCNALEAGAPIGSGESLKEELSFLRRQTEAMCQLAKDAVAFVKVYDTQLERQNISRAALYEILQTVVNASQSPKNEIISSDVNISVDIEFQYSDVLLRHGLAKLVDNAVDRAKALGGSVTLRVFLSGMNIVIAVSNPVRNPEVARERIQQAVSGSLDRQGLREAYTCFGELLSYDIDSEQRKVEFRVSFPLLKGR